MDWKLVYAWLGRCALAEGGALLLPFLCGWAHGEDGMEVFAMLAAASFALGGVLIHFGEGHRQRVDLREASAIMVMLWPFLAILGFLPFCVAGWLGLVDSFLETMSDLTAVSVGILPREAPYALRFWQALLMWTGSLNFLVILVTVLPQVSGCFGMELSALRGQGFSPMMRRMGAMAKGTAAVYAALTFFSFLLFLLSGLSPWDAATMAMRCLSTGGGAFFPGRGSYAVERAIMVSTLLGSLSIMLFRQTVTRKDFRAFWRDAEVRVFLLLVVSAGILVALHLHSSHHYGWFRSLHYGFFHMLSFLGTTGFRAAPVELWPGFDIFFLLLLSFVGGCMGSSTGGLKIIRLLVLFKMTWAGIRRTLHPNMVVSIKVGGVPVPVKVAARIMSFFFLYILVFFASAVVISMSGTALSSSVGMSLACLTGIGFAPGLAGPGEFAALSSPMKLFCCLVMEAGRIEIFAILALLQASYRDMRRKW